LELESKSIRVSASLLTPGPSGLMNEDGTLNSPNKGVGGYDRPWRKAMSKNPLSYEMDNDTLSKSPMVQAKGR
jgi:hypothetical protein|tara:strand:- start:400 stop:618 length:219 start_codon:yes stop_codon:yes gene_type:complete